MTEKWRTTRTSDLPLFVMDKYLGWPLETGAVCLVDEKEGEPTILNQFVISPRVDVHCHLIEGFESRSSSAEELKRLYDALARCGYPQRSLGPTQRPLTPEDAKYCQSKKTSSVDVAKQIAFASFALSNNAKDAVPFVLGAAMRAGAPYSLFTNTQHNRHAIAVPLGLDLAFIPMSVSDSEYRSDWTVAAGLWFRDLFQSRIRDEESPEHLKSFFDFSQAAYFTDPDEKLLNESLCRTAEIARYSRGAIQPFLPFDPRRWCPATRKEIPCHFKDVNDYLNRFLLANNNAASNSDDKKYRGYSGLKFYTRHGWCLKNNQSLYGNSVGEKVDSQVASVLKFASDHDIPITNHHSPGGTPVNGFVVPPNEMVQKNGTGVPAPPAPLNGTPELFAKWAAWVAAAEVAFFCEYVERTASPSIWEPVLAINEYKNMRVNLAHAGSASAIYAHLNPQACKYDIHLVMNRLLENAGKTDVTEYGMELEDIESLIESPMIVQHELFPHVFWSAVKRRLMDYCRNIMKVGPIKFPARFTKLNSACQKRFLAPWKKQCLAERAIVTKEKLKKLEENGESASYPWPPVSGSAFCKFVEDCSNLSMNALKTMQGSESWSKWTDTWWKTTISDRNDVANRRKENWFETILRLCRSHENVYVDFSYSTSQSEMLVTKPRTAAGPKIVSQQAIGIALRMMLNDSELKHKAMFGSDWYLIEQDIGTADDAWRLFKECIEQTAGLSQDQWDQFSGQNAMRFLNLTDRTDAIKAFCKSGKDPNLRPWPWIIAPIDFGLIRLKSEKKTKFTFEIHNELKESVNIKHQFIVPPDNQTKGENR